MPGVRNYPLERLRDSIISYATVTGRRPTYEYALMAGINDTDAELKALVRFTKRTLCHVNLIQLNEVKGSPIKPSTPERLQASRPPSKRSASTPPSAILADRTSTPPVDSLSRRARGTRS